MTRGKQPCPCCGHCTLPERGRFEICPVCLWEDDGHDDVDAHVDRGGPNAGMTLWQARANFLKFGACGERVAKLTRRPASDEPKTRHWSLLDGVAVELIPATDVTPWNLLHDGTIVGLQRHGDRVSVRVEIAYLRTRYQAPGDGFQLELLDGSKIEYIPYDEPPISSLDEIASLEPEIVSADTEDGTVSVWGSDGALRLRYHALALRLDDGSPLSLSALVECARAYWDEWERQRP